MYIVNMTSAGACELGKSVCTLGLPVFVHWQGRDAHTSSVRQHVLCSSRAADGYLLCNSGHCLPQLLIVHVTSRAAALDEVDWLRSRLEILESSLLASSSDGQLLNRRAAPQRHASQHPAACFSWDIMLWGRLVARGLAAGVELMKQSPWQGVSLVSTARGLLQDPHFPCMQDAGGAGQARAAPAAAAASHTPAHCRRCFACGGRCGGRLPNGRRRRCCSGRAAPCSDARHHSRRRTGGCQCSAGGSQR